MNINSSLNQQILFTEEIEKYSLSFDALYLKLFPDDFFVKEKSELFRELYKNEYMLIPR